MDVSQLPENLRNYVNAAIANVDITGGTLAALLQGDMSNYANDHSRADAAFVRQLANDGLSPDECDMMMRASGMMREKWDSKRGDSTYGSDTIAMVFADMPAGNVTKVASIETAKLRLNLDDGLVKFSDVLPLPRDFVIHNLMLVAKSCLLAGLGGVSKSQLILQAVVCTVLGIPFMGRPTKPGAALILFGEEDAEEISRRVNAIAKVMRLSREQMDLIHKRLRAFPMVGLDMRLTQPIGGALAGTGFVQDILGAITELETTAGLPVRMVVLDHLGLIHGGDFNAREDAVQTMRYVNHIAQESGAAVIVLAHSPKAAINADAVSVADVAGSAGFVDQSRGAYILRTMDDTEGKRYGIDPAERKSFVSLTTVKANYTENGGVLWMQRRKVEGYEVSVLHHVELHEPAKEPKGGSTKLRRAIIELVTEKTSLSKENLLGFSGVKDGRIRGSKDAVRTEVEMMLADGVLSFRDPTDEERARLRIKGKTNGFLVVCNELAQERI